MSDTNTRPEVQAPSMVEVLTLAVRMYRVLDPPAAAWGILKGRGFRPATRSRNWYRFLDIRLPGSLDILLAIEEMLKRHSLEFQIKPMRRSKRPGKTTIPSAERWLRDKNLGAGEGRSA